MKKIAIKYGLWMFAGFTVFFLVMYLLGLGDKTYLRLFNGLIHMSLIYAAIRSYRETFEDTVSNYVSGVAVGIYTSAVGVIPFVVFMLLFMALNTDFMAVVRDNIEIGKYLNPVTASLFILVEGIAISLIGSYIVTRIVDMNHPKLHSNKYDGPTGN